MSVAFELHMHDQASAHSLIQQVGSLATFFSRQNRHAADVRLARIAMVIDLGVEAQSSEYSSDGDDPGFRLFGT